MDYKTSQDFLLGAIIGGAVGAAAALFLTPVSGKDFRHQVRNGFGHLNGDAPPRRAPASKKTAFSAHASAKKEEKTPAATKGKPAQKKTKEAAAQREPTQRASRTRRPARATA